MEPAPGRIPEQSIPRGYAEYTPPADLREAVECFWTRTSDSPDPAPGHRVLPDGSTDILFRFLDGGGPGARGTGSVVGTMTRPLVVRDPDPACYIGVRFRPGYARMALGVPAIEVTDENVPLRAFARVGAVEEEQVAGAPTPAAKLAALESLVRRRLAGAGGPPPTVRAALRQIAAADGNVRVEALAGGLGVSRQHLARQFAEHAGVPPKVMARVVRVRAALARASSGGARADWGRICQDLGFYDQSHFIGEFRTIVGLPPGEWAGGS